MCAMTRLAVSEFNKDTNISMRESVDFHSSTLHGHDFYELEIVTAGSGISRLNGKDVSAEYGTVFFMTPADFHEYDSVDGFCLYNIQFTAEAISSETLERLVSKRERIYKPGKDVFPKICTLASVMLELYKDDADHNIVTHIFESILMLIFNGATQSAESAGESGRSMQQAITYIHAHFKENPTLTAVAAHISLNENYFCSKFRAYTKTSYKEYLKALKLRYARRLVLATTLPMIEIAEQSGYGSQSHFNREFKEYYGISPLKLRRSPK